MSAARSETRWEWRTELEQLVYPVETRGQPCHRIRYREHGGRRWRSVVLITGSHATPTEAMILQAIEAHAA